MTVMMARGYKVGDFRCGRSNSHNKNPVTRETNEYRDRQQAIQVKALPSVGISDPARTLKTVLNKSEARDGRPWVGEANSLLFTNLVGRSE